MTLVVNFVRTGPSAKLFPAVDAILDAIVTSHTHTEM